MCRGKLAPGSALRGSSDFLASVTKRASLSLFTSEGHHSCSEGADRALSSQKERTHPVSTGEFVDASDAELITSTRSGNRAAYAELWQRHADVGLGIARRATAAFDPEDLLAEAYANILEAIMRGHGPTGAFRPYLSTVVRNIAGRWALSLKESTVDDLEELIDQRMLDDQHELDDQQVLIRAFRTLSPRWQEVLWLLEVNELKPRQVAQQLNLKPNSVSALATRAREGLREAWIEAHLSNASHDPECERTVSALPTLARNTLPATQKARALAHLESCESCRLIHAEAVEVASRLRSAVVPLIIGIGATTSLTAGLLPGGAAGAAATGFKGSGSVALITSTKGIIVSGVVGITAVAAAATIAVAPALTPSPKPPAVPQQETAAPTAGAPLDPAEAREQVRGVVYSKNEAKWITPAVDVVPPKPTTTAPSPDMEAPRFSFEPGSTLDPSSPALSGESLPFAKIILVLKSDTAAHSVLSTQANEAGAWQVSLPDTPVGNYTAWAYQEVDHRRSDARSTEFKFEGLPGSAPLISQVQSENGKFSPRVSGTGDPGSTVLVKLNGVKNEGTVAHSGSWTVTTSKGAIVGTNQLSVVQFDPKTLVFSESSSVSEFELVPPSVSVAAYASQVELRVVSEPGSWVELESLDRKFSHCIKGSLGTNVVSLQRTGSSTGTSPAFELKARYVSEDGSQRGPWSAPHS